MTTQYKFASNNNNVAGLTLPPYQPRTDTPVRWETFTPELGIVQRRGGGTLVFNYAALTYAEYTELLTFYGVANDGVISKQCTVAAREPDGTTYTNYNAVLTLTGIGQRGTRYWRDLELTFTKMVEIP